MQDATLLDGLRRKYHALSDVLDERSRRQWAAAEARELGWGGISTLARATGLARDTIRTGLRELAHRAAHPDDWPDARLRRPGAGRKPLTALDPDLRRALDTLVDPATRGDPEAPLRWTCKSTAKLAAELTRRGHPVSPRTVAALLRAEGYSLQANRKTREGNQHPDRDAQFDHLNARVRACQAAGWPVISVDTKKKELVGDFRNGGREWQPAGQPESVRVHDFPDPSLGKAIPYGVYDLTHNQGWVSVGITHDAAQFAVASIRRWWAEMGSAKFPSARRLLITADGGGSNGTRNRLWKVSLQELADELGLVLQVCHFPPGTSKWNKIEHRLFCYITQNWRGRPLVSQAAIVSLIAATTTTAGLVVRSALDATKYEKGIKVSDEELAHVKLAPDKFHGEWNYRINPRKQVGK
jgi:hypothetical protein